MWSTTDFYDSRDIKSDSEDSHDTDWVYFVLNSVLVIMSSLAAITASVIHIAENCERKYEANDEGLAIAQGEILTMQKQSSVPSRSSSVSPVSQSSRRHALINHCNHLSQIMHDLEWLIIALFTLLCVIYALLLLIEQVGGVQNILCTQSTITILSGAFQFGIGLMHAFFICHLHVLYKSHNNLNLHSLAMAQMPQISYRPCTLWICILLIISVTIACCVAITIWLDFEAYPVVFIDALNEHRWCQTVARGYLSPVVGGTEGLVFVCILALYLRPLYILRRHVVLNMGVDISTDLNRWLYRTVKTSVLALTASTVTMVGAVIIGWQSGLWPTFIVMPINCMCVVLMSDFYPKGYRFFCCLFVRCQQAIYVVPTVHRQLQSPLVRHANGAHSAEVDIGDAELQDLQDDDVDDDMRHGHGHAAALISSGQRRNSTRKDEKQHKIGVAMNSKHAQMTTLDGMIMADMMNSVLTLKPNVDDAAMVESNSSLHEL